MDSTAQSMKILKNPKPNNPTVTLEKLRAITAIRSPKK